MKFKLVSGLPWLFWPHDLHFPTCIPFSTDIFSCMCCAHTTSMPLYSWMTVSLPLISPNSIASPTSPMNSLLTAVVLTSVSRILRGETYSMYTSLPRHHSLASFVTYFFPSMVLYVASERHPSFTFMLRVAILAITALQSTYYVPDTS